MSFLAKFHKKYVKIMPRFLQVIIRPIWRMYWIPYSKIKGIVSSKLCTKMSVPWKRASFVYETLDYVRHSSLELVAREIYENNVSGNVAELGVFQGHFAQYINQVFPERKLYLFDTFEDFRDSDVRTEKNLKLYVPDEDAFTKLYISINSYIL